MNLCIIQDKLPFHAPGGAEFMGWSTAKALAARGHRITLFTAGCSLYSGEHQIEGVNVHFMDDAPLGENDFDQHFAKLVVARAIQNPAYQFDAVMIRGWRTAGYAGQIYAQSPFPLPVLGHTAGLGFSYQLFDKNRLIWRDGRLSSGMKIKKILLRTRQYFLRTYFLERSVRFLDGFSSVSSHALNLAHRLYGIPINKLHLIHDGLPARQFKPGRQKPVANQILFVGSLFKRKGLHILIEALPKIIATAGKVTLRVIGDGPELNNLKEQVKQLQLESHVIFTGTVENSKINAIMRQSALFVNPTLSTIGYETTQIEAMLSGCLVITPKAGSQTTVVRPDTGLTFKQGHPDSLANAVIRVLQMKEIRKTKMIESARRRALTEFTVERMGEMAERALIRIIDYSKK